MTKPSQRRNPISRRQFLGYGGTATVLLGLPVIGSAQKAELLIGGPASPEKQFRDLFFDPFEKKTGVKIFYEGTNSLTNLAKMRAEKAAPKRSLVFMDDVVLMVAMREKLITPLPASVKNTAEILPRSIGTDRHWVNYMVMKAGIAMNTRVGKPVVSWADMWKPEFKGRVIVPSLKNTEGLWPFFMAASLQTGKPLAEAQFDADAAFTMMKKLKPNLLTIYINAPQAMSLLQQGEAWYIPGQFSQNVLRFKEQGQPIDFAQPKEGGFAMPQSVAMVAGAPHLDLAAELVNEILGAEAQHKVVDGLYSSPVNRKVPISEKFRGSIPDAEATVKELFLADWNNIFQNRAAWIERWDREIAG